ncbi:MAG: M48 family metalloprotease [Myxococcota bacterium]
MRRYFLDQGQRANQLKTVGLVALVATLIGAVAHLVFGPLGIIGTLAFLAVGSNVRFSPEWSIRYQGGRPLAYYSAPELHELVSVLARRARVRTPTLMYIPSDVPNAMATGRADGPSAIGITRGALAVLDRRELTGVLAHEIAHLLHGDTRLFQWTGLATQSLVKALRIALWLTAGVAILGGTGLTLVLQLAVLATLVPMGLIVLTAALSRTREFAADQKAAELTGDPRALASALSRLQRFERRWWHRAFRAPELPSALRTHPSTEERVDRLLRLTANVPESTRRAIPSFFSSRAAPPFFSSPIR